jgi:hypothetical protein
MKTTVIAFTISCILLASLLIVTVTVETEATYKHEVLYSDGAVKALLLFHPRHAYHRIDRGCRSHW